jgi:hypothetical protein
MARTNRLFELIQSLTPAEKRYFRIFASRSSKEAKPNYELLFDAMEASSHYDEQELLKRFEGSAISKNFKHTQTYLFELIVKSLAAFNAANDQAFGLLDDLKALRVLIEKGQTDAAARLYRRSWKNAQDLQLDGILLELLKLKETIFRSRIHDDKLFDLRQEISMEAQQVVRSLENRLVFKSMKDKSMDALRRIHLVRSKEAEAELIELSKAPDDIDPDNLGPVPAYFYYLQQTTLPWCLRNFPDLFKVSSKAIASIQSHRTRGKFYDLMLQSFYFTMLYSALHLKKQDVYEKHIEDFLSVNKKAYSRIGATKALLIQNVHQLELERLRLQRDYSGILEYAAGHRRSLLANWKKMHPEIKNAIALRIMEAALFQSELDECLDWANRVFEEEKHLPTKAQSGYVRIIAILARYQRRDYRVLESQIRSCRQFLEKNNLLFETEKQILRELNKISQNDSSDDVSQLRRLQGSIKDLFYNNHYESLFALELDILYWLELQSAEK